MTAPAATARRHAVFHPLQVAAVERLTADAVAVTFDVPPGLAADYRFVQGQHVTLRTVVDGVDLRRNYSICAPATVGGRLRVAVKRLEGGAFSAWVHDRLRPGDTVDVMTPTGHFYVPLDPQTARHHCFVAAGSGITPVLSLLATTLEVEPRSRCTLVYGNRTSADVMFLEELQDLKDRYPERLAMLHVLSRETQESPLLCGRIDRDRVALLTERLLPVDTVDEWFLCGPYAMVQDVREALLAAGVDAAHVHVELFHVDGEGPRAVAVVERPAGASAAGAATVLLDGRATTLSVRAGEAVLDALLRVRADAPYACKGGVCGTCRARLVAGEVRMRRNFALSPEELDDGFVLTCQAEPASDEVTLDFDA